MPVPERRSPLSTVIICEKPSQAANIRAAIGSEHGAILSAQGHLLRLQEPGEANAAWQEWSHDLLIPPNGRYAYVPDRAGGKSKRLTEIREALKGATRVIIATDCDREGQAIGDELIHHFRFAGDVQRAMFSAEDETSLRRAFAALEPNQNYRTLYDAAVARQQADQIFNLTLTRSATLALRPIGWRKALGIGRVKTPTLAILCRRELEITNFMPRAFHEIGVTVAGADGQVGLWHRPRGETRVYDRDRAARIERAVSAYSGPIGVTFEHKRSRPPLPLDLPALQKAAAKWGWTAARTLEVAQSLYEYHKITTYPRAETRHLPESLAATASALLDHLRGLERFTVSAPAHVEVRTGRGAAYSDAGLKGASHHAIIPNHNVGDRFALILPSLTNDELQLFDLIARTWLAAVSPDYEYDETMMHLALPVDGDMIEFSVRGRVDTAPGWKVALASDDTDDVEGEETAQALPPIADGESVRVVQVSVVQKTTEPPKRYNEGELIDAMKNAWRFVPEPALQERLKEAKGIGTPATRDTIIEGLKHQEMIGTEKGRLKPTELGMWLFETLDRTAPDVVDIAATAKMESSLDEVLAGAVDPDSVIRSVADHAAAIVETIRTAASDAIPIHLRRPPTPKMLEAARAKAKREGGRLPSGISDDFDACRAYLGPIGDGPRQPSAAQLVLAKWISAENGVPIPSETVSDTKLLSAWIDANTKSRQAAPASPKQMEWIHKLVGEGRKPPKGFPDAVSMKDAAAFLDSAFKKKR